MTKKSKNIIAIIIIIVLLISLGLTFHCAKTSERDNTMMIKDNQMMERTKKEQVERDLRKKEQESDKEIVEDKNDATIQNNTNLEDKANQLRKPDPRDARGSTRQMAKANGIRENKAISLKHVILIVLETFLLGGSVMFLIMNNINKEESIVYKKEDVKKER